MCIRDSIIPVRGEGPEIRATDGPESMVAPFECLVCNLDYGKPSNEDGSAKSDVAFPTFIGPSPFCAVRSTTVLARSRRLSIIVNVLQLSLTRIPT